MDDKKTIVNASQFFNDFSCIDNFFILENGEEEYWNWPSKIGNGFFYVLKLKPGLLLSIANYQLKSPISIFFRTFQNCYELCYPLLQSCSSNQFDWESEYIDFKSEPNKGYLSFISNWYGMKNCPAGIPVTYLGIYIKPDLFLSFLKNSGLNFENGYNDFLAKAVSNQSFFYLSINQLVSMKLYEILSCSYKGGLKRFFLESKTLDLIILSLSQLADSKENNTPSFILKQNDFEIIQYIRDLLLENMKTPFSLDQLSKIAGMNKNKLNQNFRDVYGSSIFDYLRTCRLEKAKQLLMNGKMNVTEAAYEVGYAQQSNFTKEFKKFYGKNPTNFVLSN